MVAPSRVRELKQNPVKVAGKGRVAPSRVRELKPSVLVLKVLQRKVAPSRVRELKLDGHITI